MDNQKGIIINQAYEIIRKTYKEIDRLKDDIADLLSDYEPSMKYDEEYSYGGKYLHLRANHTYLFKRALEESEVENIKEERILAVICIFHEEGDINRISLRNQPELWVGLFDIKNKKEKCRPWDIYNLLKLDERKHFSDGELRIGGDIFEYYWMNVETEQKEKEEWKGWFVGYPLVDIRDKEVLKAKIMEKLFKVGVQSNT